jgi:hypothetical protein
MTVGGQKEYNNAFISKIITDPPGLTMGSSSDDLVISHYFGWKYTSTACNHSS